jgi:hypothetical protein
MFSTWLVHGFFFFSLFEFVGAAKIFLSERVCRILEREIGSGTVWEDLDESFAQDVGKREFS